jgi:hypothetical protein
MISIMRQGIGIHGVNQKLKGNQHSVPNFLNFSGYADDIDSANNALKER